MRRVTLGPDDRERIVEAIRSHLSSRSDVSLAYVHGSLTRRTEHVGDVDVAVLLSGDPDAEASLRTELALEEELARTVGSDVPVDVRVLNHAPLAFRYAVIRDGEVLLCRETGVRDDFEGGTLALYLDFRPHLEALRRGSLGPGS